jgi:hypothetical protein
VSFKNLKDAVNANSYMGLYTLKTYDTIKCQQLCDAANLCTAFNMYFERDPTVDPGDACPNPPSFTNIKCTLWGSGVTTEAAVNAGQYRNQFQVVIAGSNGYTKNLPPAAQSGFDGPAGLGGAINAPLNAAGKNTYIGVKYFPGVYDAGKCAAACQANTGYNHRHPRSDGTYDACNFFNAYLISVNNVPDGTTARSTPRHGASSIAPTMDSTVAATTTPLALAMVIPSTPRILATSRPSLGNT